MSGEDGLTGFCSDATITSPYPTDGEARGRHFTHLDTAGRLVVSVTKRNVVSSLNQNLKVLHGRFFFLLF
jgi:hypothetical protein